MKTQSLINKFKKAGFKIEQSTHNKSHFFVKGSVYLCEWYDQEGSAQCPRVRRHNDRDDSMSDYCAGVFVDTIKDALHYVQKII